MFLTDVPQGGAHVTETRTTTRTEVAARGNGNLGVYEPVRQQCSYHSRCAGKLDHIEP
jgi:hypothetical protein